MLYTNTNTNTKSSLYDNIELLNKKNNINIFLNNFNKFLKVNKLLTEILFKYFDYEKNELINFIENNYKNYKNILVKELKNSKLSEDEKTSLKEKIELSLNFDLKEHLSFSENIVLYNNEKRKFKL